MALILVSCGGNPNVEPTGGGASGKLKVTTTVNMVSDLVREVGGEHVVVSELMGPGVDPHLFKASAGDVDKLMNADVVFYVGLLLEGKIQDTLDKVESAYAVASKINTIRNPCRPLSSKVVSRSSRMTESSFQTVSSTPRGKRVAISAT